MDTTKIKQAITRLYGLLNRGAYIDMERYQLFKGKGYEHKTALSFSSSFLYSLREHNEVVKGGLSN